jgi:uncharacterized membrane protein
MNNTLWILQSLLSVVFALHGMFMLNIPKNLWETVVKKMGYSLPFLKIIGSLEVLGSLGLILPSWTQIMPLLSPLAALGLTIIMIGAVNTHVQHGERRQMIGTGLITLLLAFIVVGRFWLAPI